MPYVLEVGSQTLIIEDGDAERVLTELARLTRIQIWNRAGGPDSYFHSYYRIWQHHQRYHDLNLFLWAVEGLGDATLPAASRVNRIRALNRMLGSSLTPGRIARFFDRFDEYNRLQDSFVRDMRLYLDAVIGGTGRLVTYTTLVRDGSFVILSAAASVLTAGGSTAAQVATASAGTALMRSAAANFLIAQIEHSATNIGRTMAGERVTVRETGDEIVTDVIASLSDAALGEIVGHFMEPLVGDATRLARREIDRGNLTRGMSIEISNSQLENAVRDAIQQMLREGVRLVRRLFESSPPSGTERVFARLFADGFMADRYFRGILEDQIETYAMR